MPLKHARTPLSANSPAGGVALLRLYVDIALWRRGPQDLPAAPLLLPLTVLGYFLVYVAAEWLVGAMMGGSAAQRTGIPLLAFDVLYVALWYWLLLRLFRRVERYGQTAAAMFGCAALLTPPLALAAQLVMLSDARSMAWLLPVAQLAFIALLVWSVMVSAHILRHALERSLPVCVILVVAQLVSEWLLVWALP